MIERHRCDKQIVDAAIAGIEPSDESLDALVPIGVASTSGNGVDEPLEALVGREREQVAELEPGAKHPETGLHHAQQSERAEADPVRRDEHAERPRVERRGDVVEEAGFGGHR